MQFFFFSAIVSFFLFAPILRIQTIKALLIRKPFIQMSIGVAIVVVFLLAELTRFPEYIVGGVAIRPTEAVRILLGFYFGCTFWFLVNHLLDDAHRIFPGLPVRPLPLWRFLLTTGGWPRLFVNWPALVLVAVFVVALVVPHIDSFASRITRIQVGAVDLSFASFNTDAYVAVDELVMVEEREEFPDIAAFYLIYNLLVSLDRDQDLVNLANLGIVDNGRKHIPDRKKRGSFKERSLPHWLKGGDSESLFRDSRVFLEKILVPYAECLKLMIDTKTDRPAVRTSVGQVSLALERFLVGSGGSVTDVMNKMRQSISEMEKLVIVSNDLCFVEFETFLRSSVAFGTFDQASFEKNVRASYYVYLYIGYLLVFQDNIAKAITFLDQFRDRFDDEVNYNEARAQLSYYSDESPEDTLRFLKKVLDRTSSLMKAMDEIVDSVDEQWMAIYKVQRMRLEKRSLEGENTAAYEVARMLATGHIVNDEWRYIGRSYLRSLERKVDDGNVTILGDKHNRMVVADTVGFGIVVFGLYDNTLDRERVGKATEYLREARELAHEVGGSTHQKLIRNHNRFVARIIAQKGLRLE